MIRAFTFLIFLGFFGREPLRAQPLSETQKLASLCKVWGFLKYHHPKVAKGRVDWDQQLIRLMHAVRKASSREELALLYSSLLDELGPVKLCRKCSLESQIPDWQKRNLDLSFLEDTLLMTPALREKLSYIRNNRHQGRNAYVSTYPRIGNPDFSREKAYAEMPLPEEPYRLLGLFRYWNAIQYFFPYKYAIGQNWNLTLEKLIPLFEQATDTLAYRNALLVMRTQIQDSHGFIKSAPPYRFLLSHWGDYYVPFWVKFLDRKAVIVGFYNDSLAALDQLKTGMVITRINGEPLDTVLERKRPFIATSNETTLWRDLGNSLWRGTTPEIQVTLEENGKETVRSIHRYPFRTFRYTYKLDGPVGRWLGDSIGYLHLGHLQIRQVDSVMQVFRNSKALILDLRTYPQGTMHSLARHLNPRPTVFAQLTFPLLNHPGIFYTRLFYAGNRAKTDYYPGKVVILVNEETQSQAEFTAMVLQTAPRAILVGSPTAGADGDISWIALPGGYETAFSGLGVYYPDGRETQRIGLIPDVKVYPTISGIQAGRDEVLEKALELTKKP